MLRIIADVNIPFLRGVLEPYADVTYVPGDLITREVTSKADALVIRTRTKCNAVLLEKTPVRFIATATIGYDHIDTLWCEQNNIVWTNAPGCNSSSVQQYVASALLKLAEKENRELKELTIGIVGVGNVGSKIAKFAEACGMRTLLNDPPRVRTEGGAEFVPLKTVLKESDIITLHVPLNYSGEDATWHLFDEECFRKMQPGTWFINTSRGEVIDTGSLKRALAGGKPAEAVIDVWENEPLPDTDLMKSVFIATPHIAGYSADGKANGTAMAVNALCEFFDLPLKNWYPQDIPKPSSPEIFLNCHGKKAEEIISEAVLNTYDITSDDHALRANPGNFEKLRGDYPLRREFPAYSLCLSGCTEEVRATLRNIGFRVICNQ